MKIGWKYREHSMNKTWKTRKHQGWIWVFAPSCFVQIWCVLERTENISSPLTDSSSVLHGKNAFRGAIQRVISSKCRHRNDRNSNSKYYIQVFGWGSATLFSACLWKEGSYCFFSSFFLIQEMRMCQILPMSALSGWGLYAGQLQEVQNYIKCCWASKAYNFFKTSGRLAAKVKQHRKLAMACNGIYQIHQIWSFSGKVSYFIDDLPIEQLISW